VEQKDKGEKVSCFGMEEEYNGSGAAADNVIHGNRRTNIFSLYYSNADIHIFICLLLWLQLQ